MNTGRSRANARKIAPLFWRPRRLLRYFRDPAAPLGPKLLFFVSILYVVLPTDLIPDLVPIIGWLDDLGLTSAALAWLWGSLDRWERAGSAAGGELEAESTGGPEGAAESTVRLSEPKPASDRSPPAE